MSSGDRTSIKASHLNAEPHLYSNALHLSSWLFLWFVKFLLSFNPIIQRACSPFYTAVTRELNKHIKSTIMAINEAIVIPQHKSDLCGAPFHTLFSSDNTLSMFLKQVPLISLPVRIVKPLSSYVVQLFYPI